MTVRKAIALAIIGLISLAAPASAVIGFCARMPCCSPAVHHEISFTTEGVDCCTRISCYEAPSHELTTRTIIKSTAVPASILAPGVALASSPSFLDVAFQDTSPPRTSAERLAILSILIV